MKKFALLTSLLISTNSIASELHNFNDIKNTVLAGKTIHMVIDFSKCSSSNKEMAQSMGVGFFTPDALIVTVTGYIATSFKHFTLNNPSFPGKPVYEFVKYKISEDNSVSVIIQMLNAANYTPISDKFSFMCQLETAAKIYD